MKNSKFIFAVFAVIFILTGCEKGDPTALKEAVRLASLNISSITVEPADGTITTSYSYQFTAIGHQPDGSTTDITNSVVWASSNDAIATVDGNGLVATVTDGSVAITASLSSLTGSTSLEASSAALDSIAIFADTTTPSDLSVSACKNLQLKAIGTYVGETNPRDNIPITNNVTWSVENGNGSFSSQGYLRTKSAGTIGVQAILDGTPGSADVTAVADLSSITVEPADTTISRNATLQYSATGTYANASTADITENALWVSGTQGTADFNTPESNGLITGLATGSTIVTASCGTAPGTGIEGTTNLNVSEDEVLDYLRFEDPNAVEITNFNTVVGTVTQITLYAYFTDGEKRDVTEDSQWNLNAGIGVITVNNNSGDKGKITALTEGQASVIAEYQQREKVLTVNVLQP